MTIAVGPHVAAQGTSSTVTTGSIDTTGMSFSAIVLGTGNATTPTDSKSNTYSPLTKRGANPNERMWYNENPAVGSGHTFTSPSVASSFPALCALTFSGTLTSGAFDAEVGSSSVSPASTGSLTPGGNGYLLIYGMECDYNNLPSVSVGTLSDALGFNGGVSYGATAYYEIQGTAAARNATFTCSGPGSLMNVAAASFKPAGGGGGGGTPHPTRVSMTGAGG